MNKTIYIHGLNSSKESKKYILLQTIYPEIEIFEWKTTDTDIVSRLLLLANTITGGEISIIGDSTGANFALQLRDMLFNRDVYNVKLVLMAPLVCINYRISGDWFPTNLEKQMKPFNAISNALIIVPTNDEIINHRFTRWTKCYSTIVEVDDVHRLLNFENMIHLITKYL